MVKLLASQFCSLFLLFYSGVISMMGGDGMGIGVLSWFCSPVSIFSAEMVSGATNENIGEMV